MLISFEGIDGSGKSSQAKILSQSLRERGYTVVEVREPGGTVLGEQIRAILLDPESSIDPVAELLLFSAARAQLTREVIVPALQKGHVVIADRFSDSTVAYQGAGRGVADVESVALSQHLATSGVQPMRTYLISVTVETATRRRSQSRDRIESSGTAFYERVSKGYRQIAASTDRVRVIDGSRPLKEIAADVLDDAMNLLQS